MFRYYSSLLSCVCIFFGMLPIVYSNDQKIPSNESISISKYSECNSKYNQLLDELESIQSSHKSRIKTLTSTVKEYKEESDKFKRQFESYRDRYDSIMEKNSEMERALRKMHMASQHTYVNTTLIQQDIVRWVSKVSDRALLFIEISILQNRWVQNSYIKMIRPVLHNVIFGPYRTYADHYVQKLYNYLRSSCPSLEILRYSLISMLKDGSKMILKYLEGSSSSSSNSSSSSDPSTNDNDIFIGKSFPNRNGYRSNHQYKKKNMKNAKLITTSRWKRLLIQFCNSCQRNATVHVDTMMQILMLYLAFRGWIILSRTMMMKIILFIDIMIGNR